MPTMPVSSWEISAKDVKKQAAFYSQLFGWETEYLDDGKCALVKTGELDGMIVQMDPPGSDVFLYVEVPNVQAVVDKAVSAGGAIQSPVTTTPEVGTQAFITDPEGNSWGLNQAAPANS